MKKFSAKKAIIIAVIVVAVIIAAVAVWYFGFYTAGTIGGSALNDAGLTAAQVTGLESDYENEDGFKYYDVSFVYNAMEYEYAIDAVTGQVLHVKSESVFD